MESCVKAFLNKKGYDVNDKALTIIHACDDWYANPKRAAFLNCSI